MPIVVGARLEHYEILAPLGAGGMGEVWRARDTRLNREVAIKVLPASFANDGDRLRRFELEALATSALNQLLHLFRLKSDDNKFPTSWSRDGRFIIYSQLDPKTKSDVWVLPVAGSSQAKPFPVVRTEANDAEGILSPDGQWLAYASDVSGRIEVYVQRFPGGGGKWQLTTGGGNNPRWRGDGRELFYYAGDGKLMAAPVKSGESFETSAAVSLFEFRAGTAPGFAPFAVTADGQRFLINAVVEVEPNAPLMVVVNWAAEVKK